MLVNCTGWLIHLICGEWNAYIPKIKKKTNEKYFVILFEPRIHCIAMLCHQHLCLAYRSRLKKYFVIIYCVRQTPSVRINNNNELKKIQKKTNRNRKKNLFENHTKSIDDIIICCFEIDHCFRSPAERKSAC